MPCVNEFLACVNSLNELIINKLSFNRGLIVWYPSEFTFRTSNCS